MSGIYQWCGSEPLTKYGMVRAMSAAFGLPHDHVKGNAEKPAAGVGTARPHDTTMDRSRLESLGISEHTEFAAGIKECLSKWVEKQ